MFRDATNANFSLQRESPCVDTGDIGWYDGITIFSDYKIPSEYFATDIFGNPRVSGTNVDMGAIEKVIRGDGGPYTELVDGIDWIFSVYNGQSTIGLGGEAAILTSTSGRIVVPDELGGHPVVSINSYAFSGCSAITSVEIPATVSNVYKRAFSYCTSLGVVEFPASLSYLDNATFRYASNVTNITCLGDAPKMDAETFKDPTPNFTVSVRWKAKGWDDDGDGKWKGHTLLYYDCPYGPELVALYRFDGSLADSSGHEYTLHSNKAESYAYDRFGKENSAYWLDGGTCLYEAAEGEKAISWGTNYTFACWFKASEETALKEVASSGISGIGSAVKYLCGHTDYPISIGTNGINVFEHADGFLPAVYKYEGNLGTSWHQIALTVSNSETVVVYLDGAPQGSFRKLRPLYGAWLGLGEYSTTLELNARGLGAFCYGGHFKGGVDDARFYNCALSAEKVKELYDSEKPKLSDGLVARYEFGGSLADSTGHGYALHSNKAESYVVDRFGKEGSAYWLDGSAVLFESTTKEGGVRWGTNYTFACWFRATEETKLYDVASSGIYGTSSLIKYLCGETGFSVAIGTNGINVFEHSDSFLPAVFKYEGAIGDGWRHFAITVSENATAVVYLDGKMIGSFLKQRPRSVAYLGLGNYDTGAPSGLNALGIGAFAYGGHFKGGVDEARFYNCPLSAVEVKALYDSEKPPAPIVWTVSFDACGGVASKDTMVVTNNAAIGELPTAEWAEHNFLGWYSEIEGGTQVTPETIITNDVTFYAHWFDKSIGAITGATNVLWRTGGDVPWATEETPEGWDVRSGAISKNSETWVECVVTNGCRVAFQWKVSCEPEDEGEMYDFLSFSIDGEPKAAICGEVGWTNDVYCVSGAGEHVLRWTYQKDNRTSAGEDCGWLGRVRVDPEVPVTFEDNGATSGEVPTIPTAYLGDTITVPGKGTLAKSCHAFGGWEHEGATYSEGDELMLGTNAVEFVAVWNAKVLGLPILVSPATPHVTTEKIAVSLQTPASAQGIRYTIDGSEPTAESAVYTGPFEIEDRGVTVKAVAFADDWFDSACATWELTRAPWSAAECLNAETREFSFGGNADWVRDLGVTHDGEAAMRSGTIQDKQTSQILMPVTGAGTVSFWCRVSSEWDPETKEVYDGLAIAIDGKNVYPGLIGGEVGWTNITVGVSGAGEHVICWRYQKDKVSSAGSDCAWIDEVLWQVNETVVPAAITGDRDLPISRSWIEKDLVDRYGPGKTQAFRDKFGNDYDLAVLMPNGKTMGGNPGYVWEDYIAGTDPTDTNSVFSASISMEGGFPKVIWEPDLGVERLYKVWGKASLIGDEWQHPTNSTHRFFKVTVEMPK